jgi:prephenate dehydrogenase
MSAPCVLIVGTGLIGASMGLGLREQGCEVWLADADEGAAQVAESRGAGRRGRPQSDPDLVIVAVPPAFAPSTISEALSTYLTSTVSDVVSVKAQLQRDIEGLGSDMSRFVPGHPLAGLEVSGPAAARADLFADRVWALTPTAATDPARVAMVTAVVESLGAVVVLTTPEAHDLAVALTSHTPQVVSSLVAAGLEPLADGDVRLSGQGLRDVTRLASSDPELWTDILVNNAAPVAAALDGLIARLAAVRDGLRAGPGGAPSVRSALAAGVSGSRKVPGKHGSRPVVYAIVSVVVPDRPGELGRLFAAAADTGVNLEDVRIEHAAGRPTGLVELSVTPDAASALVEGLREGGWEIRL